MLEGLASYILNKILGDFIDGIESNQLNISLLSGDVELFNLSIKPDILENMPLPFKLKYGKVGRIFLDLPVTGFFFSYPIKIELSEIFVLVEPKAVKEWKEEVIKEAFLKATQSSLEDLEEYFKSRMAAQESDSAIVNGIINRVVDSLEIEVKNVYIRFEDTISNPSMTYAIGASIESFQLYSWNYRWMKETSSGGDYSYKTAKITNLNLINQIFQNVRVLKF